MTVWSSARERAQQEQAEFRSLAERVLAVRVKYGFTQRELAEVMGCALVTVARLEMQAGFRPRAKFIEKLEKLESSEIGR